MLTTAFVFGLGLGSILDDVEKKYEETLRAAKAVPDNSPGAFSAVRAVLDHHGLGPDSEDTYAPGSKWGYELQAPGPEPAQSGGRTYERMLLAGWGIDDSATPEYSELREEAAQLRKAVVEVEEEITNLHKALREGKAVLEEEKRILREQYRVYREDLESSSLELADIDISDLIPYHILDFNLMWGHVAPEAFKKEVNLEFYRNLKLALLEISPEEANLMTSEDVSELVLSTMDLVMAKHGQRLIEGGERGPTDHYFGVKPDRTYMAPGLLTLEEIAEDMFQYALDENTIPEGMTEEEAYDEIVAWLEEKLEEATSRTDPFWPFYEEEEEEEDRRRVVLEASYPTYHTLAPRMA